MKIAIVSKSSGVENWAEDAEQDFLLAGNEVRFIGVRHRYLAPFINDLMYSDALGGIRTSSIVATLKKFDPDVILAFGAYQLPRIVLEGIAAMPGRKAPFVGWVGIKFDDERAALSRYFDLMAYADTGLVRRHEELGLRPEAIFLPLAGRAPDAEQCVRRTDRMVFVANPNPHRSEVLSAMTSGVDVYGPAWNKTRVAAHHRVHSNRISPARVRSLYRAHRLTLNMRSDAFNIHGLNQRHFSPYPYGCAVVAETMLDLEPCFDLDREIFTWSTIAELNELYAVLLRDPARVESVAQAGARRVMGEHLYRHRLETVMRRLR